MKAERAGPECGLWDPLEGAQTQVRRGVLEKTTQILRADFPEVHDGDARKSYSTVMLCLFQLSISAIIICMNAWLQVCGLATDFMPAVPRKTYVMWMQMIDT